MLMQVRNEFRMSLSCTPSSDIFNIEIGGIANELEKFSSVQAMKKGEDRQMKRKKPKPFLTAVAVVAIGGIYSGIYDIQVQAQPSKCC